MAVAAAVFAKSSLIAENLRDEAKDKRAERSAVRMARDLHQPLAFYGHSLLVDIMGRSRGYFIAFIRAVILIISSHNVFIAHLAAIFIGDRWITANTETAWANRTSENQLFMR